eukprot:1375495-Rhodomonas_salina.1
MPREEVRALVSTGHRDNCHRFESVGLRASDLRSSADSRSSGSVRAHSPRLVAAQRISEPEIAWDIAHFSTGHRIGAQVLAPSSVPDVALKVAVQLSTVPDVA